MKVKLLAVAAMSMLLSACSSSNQAEQADEATDQTAQVQETTTENTEKQVAAAGVEVLDDDNAIRPGKGTGQVTILDFNATWCVPCQKFAPTFETAADKYTDVRFVSVDVDNNPNTAQAFGVNAVPTVIVLGKDGKELKRYEGIGDLLPSEKFIDIVESVK